MPKDYSYLEGKTFIYNNGVRKFSARVLYADYYIGLTCVAQYDSTRYLICLRGPSSPNPHKFSPTGYSAVWKGVVKRIEGGYIESENLQKLNQKYNQARSGKHTKTKIRLVSDHCAFGQ